MAVDVAGDQLDVPRVAQDEGVEQVEAEPREVDHPVGRGADLVTLVGRDPLGQAARDAGARVDRPAADDLHHPVAPPAGLDDPSAGVAADALQDTQQVALRHRRVRPDHEVGARQGVEVGRVVGDEERRVEQLAEQDRGPRRRDAVDRVGRLGGRHVVRLGADAADPVDEDRHLLHRAAHAQALEAAKLGHLERRALHLAGRVEEDLDLAVALEPGDGVDRDASHSTRCLRREPGKLYL